MSQFSKLNYPNPQKIRKKWYSLNGTWKFFIDKEERTGRKQPLPQEKFDQEILVPYSYTFKKSTIKEEKYYPIVWYQRDFEIEKKQDKTYLLNFEAVDYRCDIWLNGVHIYSHIGGHTPFTIDISQWVENKNDLQVRVEDYNEPSQPLGKQSWKKDNFLCWYTKTIGIWQNVWIEETGSLFISDFTMKADTEKAELQVDTTINQDIQALLSVEIHYQGQLIASASNQFKNRRSKFAVDVSSDLANFRLFFWSPSDPNLYDITFKVIEEGRVADTIESYFGMRKIENYGEKTYLNGQEIYQKLVLNQGYYFEGGLTGTEEEMVADLQKTKEMGFNGLRMHQKIESHKLLYLCDALGLLMWAEMPSFFEFSVEAANNFYKEIPAFVNKHINHPSVITYVVMNESWGVNEIYHNHQEQNFVNSLYYMVKSLDDSRIVIGNDGWEHTLTDVATVHDYNSDQYSMKESYARKDTSYHYSPSRTSGRKTFCPGYVNTEIPFMVSEYGGVAYEDLQEGNTWGYGERLASKAQVVEKINQLTKVVMDIPYANGFCYTQLADVEQEVNGLLDHQHRYKFDPKEIKKIMEQKQNLGFSFN